MSAPTATLRRRLGLLLAGALLAPLAGCVPTGSGTLEITAWLDDSSGLFVGNDVGVLGVPVGTVTAIEPDGAQVRVTLEVESDQPVPADAGAAVVARSVATDRYLELTPAFAEGDEQMADGAEIPLERTRTPVDFDEVLEALNTFATGIAGSEEGTEAIRQLIESGDAALAGQGRRLNRTIVSFGEAVGSLSGQREDLTGTIVSLDTLVGAIADNEDVAREFISQVADASTLLAGQRRNFRAALRALDRAVTTIARFARDNREEIRGTVEGATGVMRTMLRRQRDLTEILEVMPLTMQNLQRTQTPEGRLPVRIPPTVLFPLGGQLELLCEQLPLDLCDLISGTDPGSGPGGGRR